MTSFAIWATILGLGLLSYLLRASFIVFLGEQEIPEYLQRYLRYVSVAIIPGMIAGLVAFPASTGGKVSLVWLGASLVAVLTGTRSKNPLIIMLAGATAYILLDILI